MKSVTLLKRASLLALAFVMNSDFLGAETLAEYARKCDQEIGASVPQFNCLQGSVVPIIGKSGNKCQNPAVLGSSSDRGENAQCNEFARVGRLPTDNVDVEMRFLCRHYNPTDSSSSPIFNDIAVIQRNMKTGATCFYQSPVRVNLDGSFVPAPSTGDTRIFSIGSTSGCVSCHDNRGFIKTPFLKGVANRDKIPDPTALDSAFVPQYYFPGETTKTWNSNVVRSTSNPACTSCHVLGTENMAQTGAGTAQNFGLFAVGQKQHPQATVNGWYGPYLNGAIPNHPKPDDAINSALQHAACAGNQSASNCYVTPFQRPAPVITPGTKTLASLGYRVFGQDLPKPDTFGGDILWGQFISPEFHACSLPGGRPYIWAYPDGVIYSYTQGPNYIAYDLNALRQAGCRLPGDPEPKPNKPGKNPPKLSSLGVAVDNANHARPDNFDSIVSKGIKMSPKDHQCSWATRSLIYVFADGVIYTDNNSGDYNVFTLDMVQSKKCVLPKGIGSGNDMGTGSGSSEGGMCVYKHKEDTEGGKKGKKNKFDAFGKSRSCDKNGDWKKSCKDGNGDTDEVGCE